MHNNFNFYYNYTITMHNNFNFYYNYTLWIVDNRTVMDPLQSKYFCTVPFLHYSCQVDLHYSSHLSLMQCETLGLVPNYGLTDKLQV